jgi:preprotein translocase subunit SecF
MKNYNFAAKVFSGTFFICPVLMISMMPVNAAPDLCKNSTITVKEIESVDLQSIYSLQSKLEIHTISLKQLSSEENLYSNLKATNLVNEDNKNVNHKNRLSKQNENQINSYNTINNYISPPTNIALMNCQ